MKKSYIYIVSNQNRTTFYTGVTSDLRRRLTEHADGRGSNFAARYKLKYLVYFEEFNDLNQAISREKQIKNWRRDWKLSLIKEFNPDLKSLQY